MTKTLARWFSQGFARFGINSGFFTRLNPNAHILHRFPDRPLQYVPDGRSQLVVVDFLPIQVGFKFHYELFPELLHTILKQLRDNRADEFFRCCEVVIYVLVVGIEGSVTFAVVEPHCFAGGVVADDTLLYWKSRWSTDKTHSATVIIIIHVGNPQLKSVRLQAF